MVFLFFSFIDDNQNSCNKFTVMRVVDFNKPYVLNKLNKFQIVKTLSLTHYLNVAVTLCALEETPSVIKNIR